MYEFGHGLSYTTFVYKWVNLGVASVSTERLGNILVTASINVTNTGDKYTAAETVLLFLFPPTEITSNLTYGAPIKKLTNFEKISLAPGDYNVLQFSLAASDFLLADSSGMWGFVRGAWTLKIGSLSRRILIR